MNERIHISIAKTTTVLLLMAFLAGIHTVHAQQDPLYSQYMNNLQSVNPAYTGIRGLPTLSSVYRKQWLGFDGAPTTASFTFSMPFDSLRVSGGIDFIYDYTVPTATTALFFNYGYQFQVSEKTRMSLGLKAGFNYLEGKLTHLDRYHLDDSYILDFGDFTRFMPNFGVGGFWYGENFYAGFAIPRLLQNPYNKADNLFTTKSREERHYFLHGAYSHVLRPGIVLQPALTTIMVAGAPITADIDMAVHFNQKITFGLMYRISDAVGAYAHFNLGDMKLGFAYDLGHSRLQKHHSGTFEVLLSIDFRPKKKEIAQDEGQTLPYAEPESEPEPEFEIGELDD
jgi:type IX secretion system PorP/SprF family membrane protein